MRHPIAPSLLSSFFLLLAFAASPAFSSDFQSARTAALGGAGHAGPVLTDAIYLNPSYVSLLPGYVGSVNYATYSGGDVQPDGSKYLHGHVLNAAVQDGRSELFQAGVGATLRDDGKYINVGASKSFVRAMGVGIGAKFVMPNSGNGSSTQDFSVSTSYVLSSWFQAAVIADNLLNNSNDHAQNLYREVILGTKFNYGNFVLLYVDPHYAPSAPGSDFGYEAGLELTPFSDLFFRFGSFRASQIEELQNLRGRGLGIGLGWIAPKLSLDYSLKRVLEPVLNNTHTFGMTVYL